MCRARASSLLTLSFAVLVACEPTGTPVAAEPPIVVAQVSDPPPVEAPGELPSTTQEQFAWRPDRPDPFRSRFHDLDKPDVAGDLPRQRFDLDQLKLVAVVVGAAVPYAMVEDPSGTGHVVKVGAFVGKGGAQVRHIRRDVLVLEQVIRGTDLRPQRQLIDMPIGG